MLDTALAACLTASVHENLAFFLVGDLFKEVEAVIEVIVHNNELVVLFKLGIEQLDRVEAFAG